jgi:hypothetical protein
MFHPSMWSPDPYHYYKSSTCPIKKHNFTNINPYATYHANLLAHVSKERGRHGKAPRPPFYIEGSEFSDTDFDDAYSLDTDTTINDRLHTPYYPPQHPDLQPASSLKRVQVRMPRRAAEELRGDDVLILSPDLTRLRIHIRTNHSTETVRAAVAGDMRLRDVVRQLLPNNHSSEIIVQVKLRGEWQELGTSCKISDIAELGRDVMNDRQEVEVKLVVRSREKKTRLDVRGWEHEIGRMERMRMF